MEKKIRVSIQLISTILFFGGLFFYYKNQSHEITKWLLISGIFLFSVYLSFFQKDRNDFTIKLLSGLIYSSCLILIYSTSLGLSIYLILLSILQVYLYKKTEKNNSI